MSSPGTLQALLSRPKLVVLAGITGTVLVCWLYLVPASLDMYGRMDGVAAWMMHGTWDAGYFTLMFLMWGVMMTGMMLPSAAPAILMFGTVVRNRPQAQKSVLRSYVFAGGYLLAWAGFSLGATVLQWQLARVALLTPMMETASPVFAAGILIAAGVYQWTPFKGACLSHCRSPIEHLSQHWRPGIAGALHMGVRHGLYCLGCCWGLMLLLFIGGVMNLLWIAGITLVVLLEKLAPFGNWGGRIGGGILIAVGAWLLL